MNDFKYENKKKKSLFFSFCLAIVFGFCIAEATLAVWTYLPYRSAFFHSFFFSKALWRVFVPSAVFLPAAVLLCDLNIHRFSTGSKISVCLLGISSVMPSVFYGSERFSYIIPSLIFLFVPLTVYFFISDCDVNIGKIPGAVFGAVYILTAFLTVTLMIRATVTGTLVQVKFLFVAPITALTSPFFALYKKSGAALKKSDTHIMILRCALSALYSLILGGNAFVAYLYLTICTFILLFDICSFVRSLYQWKNS